MTDAETLYIVLVVLYLLECVVWTGPHTIAFRSTSFGAWRIVFPRAITSHAKGNAILARPLPPLGRILLCDAGAEACDGLRADAKGISGRIDAFTRLTRALLVVCNVLFMATFVGAAMLVWVGSFRLHWPWFAIGYVLLWMTTCCLFFRAHRDVFPSEITSRRELLLMMLLSPLTAIRAHDAIAKKLLLSFHPLAVADVLCSRPRFEGFAGTYYRERLYPSAKPEVVAVIEDILRETGIDPAGLLIAPERSANCRTWCPRCLSQYALPAGVCIDCGTSLKVFRQE